MTSSRDAGEEKLRHSADLLFIMERIVQYGPGLPSKVLEKSQARYQRTGKVDDLIACSLMAIGFQECMNLAFKKSR